MHAHALPQCLLTPPPAAPPRRIDEFRSVLSQVDVECTDADAARIFTLVDSSATGAVIPSKMKSALRNSGIVSEMYRDSLANFCKIFAATALFGVGIAYFESPAAAFNFITGYVVEDSLSVDNLFVFLIIFRTFKVPANLQLLCLNYGIAGAVVLRAVCIFTGLALVDAFEPVLLGFSAFLLYTSYTLLDLGKTEGGEDEEDEEDAPPEFITNFVDKLPTTGTFEGDKLVVAKEGGGFLATQLLLTLITIELSDLVFAVDSIPAVFAVTDDPFVVYTSNIAAILGLRSLYQILAIAVTDLEYLETGVAIVLGFIGLKLLAQFAGVPIDSLVSLSVVVGILGGSVGLSLYENRKEECKREEQTR